INSSSVSFSEKSRHPKMTTRQNKQDTDTLGNRVKRDDTCFYLEAAELVRKVQAFKRQQPNTKQDIMRQRKSSHTVVGQVFNYVWKYGPSTVQYPEK
ncbi:hypothetical protein STEG23_030869, partial [Scotinomys teguina]